MADDNDARQMLDHINAYVAEQERRFNQMSAAADVSWHDIYARESGAGNPIRFTVYWDSPEGELDVDRFFSFDAGDWAPDDVFERLAWQVSETGRELEAAGDVKSWLPSHLDY